MLYSYIEIILIQDYNNIILRPNVTSQIHSELNTLLVTDILLAVPIQINVSLGHQ